MSKAGFITANKVKGKYYYLVLKSYRDDNNVIKKDIVLNLGNKEKSCKRLKSFINDPSQVPKFMKDYNNEDFKKWLNYIDNKEGLN